MAIINEIIIHCSATKEGVDIKAATIDKWHRQNGWRCIGYNYVIDLDGTEEKGRSEEDMGAHTVGHNMHSIGICYIGGLDKDGKPKDTRTEAQKASMLRLVKELLVRYPNARLSGHNQWARKACPCFSVPQWAAANGLPFDDTVRYV